MLVFLLSLVWGWSTFVFQPSGFYCKALLRLKLLRGPWALQPLYGSWVGRGIAVVASFSSGFLVCFSLACML